MEIAAPPEWIWKVLTGDALVRWAYVFTGMRWGPPPPINVGSIREVTLLGVLTVRERFLRSHAAVCRGVFGTLSPHSISAKRSAHEDLRSRCARCSTENAAPRRPGEHRKTHVSHRQLADIDQKLMGFLSRT
ncbi:hypothetical protein AB0935_15205 [Streptomyces sp. NPDC007027]|uniref:hypothetical protein n=1 Tax=unclassified Streptomyces TaxID=2593676 RepID=UPI0034571374